MAIPRYRPAAIVLLMVLILAPSPAHAQTDVAGSKDHPMFSRMPGFYISDYTQKEFASYDFTDEDGNDVSVEGQMTEITYSLPEGSAPAATLKIIRNFTNAARKLGGGAYEYTDHTGYLNVRRDGQEVWVKVYATEDSYTLTIVQKGEVKQEITADWMLEELDRSGHVALYINFDTGKATIRPESQAIVGQIVRLLKGNPDLKIEVQGHTDDVGSDQANLELSEQRAQAVMQAIVAQGIDPQRLTAAGFGEKTPVADNGTEEGKAKNRRVELVKK